MTDAEAAAAMVALSDPPPKTYDWWDEVPEHLKTKTALGEMGLNYRGKPRAWIEYGRGKRHRRYPLYSIAEAVPKRGHTHPHAVQGAKENPAG